MTLVGAPRGQGAIICQGGCCVCSCDYINGAAEQRAQPQSLPHDVEQEGRRLLQVVALCDPTGEILEALDARAAAQSLVGAVRPADTDG